MKVYVAIEEDRGMGPMVLGVYMYKHEAEKAAGGAHDDVQEAELDMKSELIEKSLGEWKDLCQLDLKKN